MERASEHGPGRERVALDAASGRVLAVGLACPENVPPFENSAMDGFAVRSFETREASPERPVRLRVLGTVSAGDPPVSGGRVPASAWEIMTGAAMPLSPGSSDEPRGEPLTYDAVIKVEETRREGTELLIERPVRAGENVRGRGEDFRSGDPLLSAGGRIGPYQVLALASLGISELEVVRRPRVAVFSTGRELASPSRLKLAPGMIRNSTGPYLQAALPLFGAEVDYRGVIADDPERFFVELQALLSGPDRPELVLTTGAVSMGVHDFVPAVLERLGARIHFHKVAIRPGKPLLFAELPGGGPLFFGVPGNPVSSAVGLRFFVVPALRALQGEAPEKPTLARLEASSRKPDGLRCFYKARLAEAEGRLQVSALPGQASFKVSPLLRSNAWVVFEEPGAEVPGGSLVSVFPLGPEGIGILDNPETAFQAHDKGCCT
ncbi:MAG: molybdopterin molybdotransferase MoeA [Oligoflexia bacterium]|nr:molybdopterin molybdotransferase MoeA [Oligoflexia bacterium]